MLKEFLGALFMTVFLIVMCGSFYLIDKYSDSNKRFFSKCESRGGVVLLTTNHSRICASKDYLEIPVRKLT